MLKRSWLIAFLGISGFFILAYTVAIYKGFVPAAEDVCSKAADSQAEDCAAYYTFLVWFWHFTETLDKYSAHIAAIATVGLVYFTYTLWRSTEKMWIVTNNTLSETRLTSERELRAYVGILGASIKLVVHNGKNQFLLGLTIKNFGVTPASDVTSAIGCVVSRSSTTAVDGTPNRVPGKVTMTPTMEQEISTYLDFDLPAGSHRDHEIRLFGRIFYRNFTGAARFTNFRMFAHIAPGDDGSITWGNCEEGNDAN